MNVVKEKKFVSTDGTERRIQLGWSSWNPTELSVRYYYEDARGRISFRAPEIPLDAAIHMVSLIKDFVGVLPDSIVKDLAKL